MIDLNARTGMATRILNSRSLTGEADETVVIIHEDHRNVLNILRHGVDTGVLSQSPTLLYFDMHDDGRSVSHLREALCMHRDCAAPREDFWQFVEWKLSQRDDDWLLAGMELGLIGDAILVGAEFDDNIRSMNGQYEDHTGAEHRIWSLPHLWTALEPGGWLQDEHHRDELEPVWGLMGYVIEPNHYRFRQEPPPKPLVLDFDMDCFTFELEGIRRAWPFEVMKELFTRSSPTGRTACEIMEQLVTRASFVSIAREPDFCGGFMQAALAFAYLNEIIFDGQLDRTS